MKIIKIQKNSVYGVFGTQKIINGGFSYINPEFIENKYKKEDKNNDERN